MPRKKSKESVYRSLCVVFAAVIAILALFIALPKIVPTEQMLPLISPELSTLGFEKVDGVDVRVVGEEGSVTLSAGCYALTAGVEASQALSIQNALQNRTPERPNAHDLTRDVFNILEIKVLMVKITELKDRAYFARMFLRQGNTLLNLAVRPSDGIAIALRLGSSIYVNRTLLERQGKYIC